MAEPVLLIDVSDRVATITLNRPDARNALNTELRRALPQAIADLDANPEVEVMILTGNGPAFCAGLDLKELGSGAQTPGEVTDRAPNNSGRHVEYTMDRGPFPVRTKPLIGAINGAAITGGFELALNCDFLVASPRAIFADTHARVGVMPGWGLAVLLPAVIGFRRARELSLTGNFLDAQEAHRIGLVNHLVPHDELLAKTRSLAADIAGNQPDGVRQMLATYDLIERSQLDRGWLIEAQEGVRFREHAGFDPAEVERRRMAIVERGRGQLDTGA
ncbi:MAG: enoyl-CoA hydratase [Acidimicrobiales bacterium]